MKSLRWFFGAPLAVGVLVAVGAAPAVLAQQGPPVYVPPQQAYAQAQSYAQQTPPNGAPPAGATQPAPLLSAQQLNDLVAPVALYPDPLLSQLLVASTYPLEVVEAEQWLQANQSLSGQALVDAAKQQNWDPSVQALVAFPDVLAKLNQDVRWTTDLGNAFLAQQADVMRAVQTMRASAQANGRLQTTPQETVTSQVQDGQSAIEIEPANPQVIYVPTYDPEYIWGAPAWGAYPALYYPSFGFGWDPGCDVGLYFGGWGFGGWGDWGWGPNWFGRSVFVNHAFFGHYGFRGYGGGFGRGIGVWSHNPVHRLGVAYPNRQLAGRFGAASRQSAFNAASRGGYGVRYGASHGISQSRGGSSQFGNRFGSQGSRGVAGGSRGFAGSPYSGGARNNGGAARSNAFGGGAARSNGSNAFGGARNFAARPSNGGAARSFGAPAGRSLNVPSSRSFSAPAGRSFSAPAGRSFSAPAGRSFSAPAARSFSAPAARSFGGGGARSFGGGGGGGRSFGGGGGHSFGGGGGHSGGGGGHSGGGGHGGRR